VRAKPATGSTRGLALAYPTAMRSSIFMLPLLLLATSNCKDEAPSGGDFGTPCGKGSGTADAELTCGSGLGCYIGYCEEQCTDDSDCQPVDGFRHECEDDGLCHIYCEEATLACPQSLGTSLMCGVIWCSGES